MAMAETRTSNLQRSAAFSSKTDYLLMGKYAVEQCIQDVGYSVFAPFTSTC